MPETDADKTPYNPFDLTKVWSHGDYPLIDVGIMELNRNPDNYFAQIGSRVLAVQHRARHRLLAGQNAASAHLLLRRCASLPAGNALRGAACQYAALPRQYYHKDGPMRFFANNPNPDAYYEPNSFNGPVERPETAEPPLRISGDADRYDHRQGNDDYSQPRALFNLFDDGQKPGSSPTSPTMQGVPDYIVERQLSHFEKVHPDCAAGVRRRRARSRRTHKLADLETPARFGVLSL